MKVQYYESSGTNCGKRRNFFFCHNVFKSHLLQRRQKVSICGKGLTLAYMKTTVSQKEKLFMSNFSFLARLFKEKASYTARLGIGVAPWLSFLYQFPLLSKPLQILLLNLQHLFTIITFFNRQEFITLSRFM